MDAHPWVSAFLVGVIVFSFGFLCLMVVLLFFRTYLEFQRRTFDVSMIVPLLAQFESASMESKFTLAARKTLEIISKGDWHSVDHATDVEPALDFLEDIGLQITKNQISDELAHQYFFATIQAYYLALTSYIKGHQKLYGKATWRYVEPLFERTFLIERSIDNTAPKHLSEKEIIQFLRQEAEKPPQI